MKNLFYCIILGFLLSYVFAMYNRNLESDEFNGAVIVEKNNTYLYEHSFVLQYPDSSIETELVYQIFYEKYEVGDTINNKKIEKNESNFN